MHSRKIHGAALALALSASALSCASDHDAGAGDPSNADRHGATGNGTAPTATAADGTTFWGNFPVFPGAGTSDYATEPLPNGMVCDVVPGADVLIPEPIRQCFFDINDPLHLHPAATLEQVLECVDEGDTVHLRLTFHPSFVDNTYGANAIGWSEDAAAAAMMVGGKKKKGGGKGGHTFDNLVGSDHAEFIVTDGNGQAVLQFKLDYLSEAPAAPSGYASLGVTDGEGEVILGDASDVVKWMTSIDLNLNERGYGSYTVDSPATDADYTPNTATPEWDYRVVYEAWIDADVFGAAGFGGASIEFVHASPSKADNNTLEVEPGECPPPPCVDSDPDTDECDPGDDDPPGELPPGCVDNDPDTFCGEGGSGGGGEAGAGGNGGDPQYCIDNPDDPSCEVD